jgi:hypothetical protein
MNITRNHLGQRMGECHYKAKLTDAQVREMRHLRERHGKGYGTLAQIFGCAPATARNICKYWTRASA